MFASIVSIPFVTTRQLVRPVDLQKNKKKISIV